MNVTKTALPIALTTTLATCVLLFQDAPVAAAPSGNPGYSWNLSRDMIPCMGNSRQPGPATEGPLR
jgi:hypothetical protein